MRALCSVVLSQTSLVCNSHRQFSSCRRIGRQSVGHQFRRDHAILANKLAHQSQRGLLIPTRLHKTIEHLAFRIDGSPQIHHLATNRDEHLIEMPDCVRLGAHRPQASGDHRSEHCHLDNQLALVIIYTSMNLSFVTWVLRGFFLDIPIEIEEAALVDGYSRWQIFLRVALPLVRPGLAATAILPVIFSWNEFLFASIVAPGNAATLPVYLAGFSASMNIDWAEYMAVGTMAVLPIMIFTLVLQRHLVRGLTFGAVR